ncbi:ATP-dependent sacrificial sulfur transferase LarE [Candidatus Saganbacteria bacterium]|nr:ATP-dependent sacrificial sulfur transferase LarE [Candidatus Saganbacteria bacterium]
MHTKLADLKSLLKDLDKAIVAFSGGVDSSFLLKVAHDVLGDNVLAVIADSPTYTADELAAAQTFCQQLGGKYLVIKTAECADENFINNPPERCFFCKQELFTELQKIAKEKNIPHVLDGSNQDDLSDYRPGSRAKKEAGVASPLQQVGLTKQEIRDLSKELGLRTWDQPAQACLASRIPYGTKITPEILKKIEAGEKYLRLLGFKPVRARHHGNLVRLELGEDSLHRLLESDMPSQVSKKFESLGYTYITIDLKGYRSGSMNEML